MGNTTEDPVDPHTDLDRALKRLESLSKEDPEVLKKEIYDTASAISFLVLEAKKANFKPGWSDSLKDADGKPVFTSEDKAEVEQVVEEYIKPMFSDSDPSDSDQSGGAQKLPLIPTKDGLVQKKVEPASLLAVPTVKLSDMSMDVIYWKVKKFIDGLDEQAHIFSREMGPFRFFYDSPIDIRIPLPGLAAIPIPPRIIPVLLEVVVETIRLIFSIGPQSNDMARKTLSIVLAIIDVSKGNWKHALMSFAGVFGKYPLLAGLLAKVFMTVLQRIAPDILDSLVFTSYMSTKSIVIGTLTWIVTTFSPDLVRKSISKSLEKMSSSDGVLGKARNIIEKKMESDPIYEVKFKNVLKSLTLSFDDLQNLQMIARQPAIMCSKDFQDALDGVREIPPMRLIFELYNIPTDPDTVGYVCGQFKNMPLDDSLKAGLDSLKS